MKAKFGREIALLMLPVLLIGAVAWLGAGSGRALLPAFLTSNPFDPGPMRLEVSSFQALKLTPLEVADGFDWKTQTTVRERGKWNVPKNWRDDGGLFGMTADLRVVYRRGAVWKKAPQPRNGKGLISMSGKATISVNLKTVLRDADEVRLRGRFARKHSYRGVLPPGWKTPQGMESYALKHFLTVESQPFDVQIKGEGEPLPSPKVSQEPQLEIVDAKWLVDSARDPQDFQHDVVVLQIRRKDGNYFDNPPQVGGRNLQIFDAEGKKLELFDHTNRKWNLNFWLDPSFSFSANRSRRHLFAVVATGQNKPKVGWDKVKPPLRLRGEIIDNGAWPQKLDVEIERLPMKTEDFGAAK